MDSCPKELEAYDKAFKQKIIEQDYLQHMWWGRYGISALIVAIDNCFNVKKAKSKYIKMPIMQEIEKNQAEMNSKPLTEEEKKKQTEQLFMKLRIMGANFDLNHKDSTVP